MYELVQVTQHVYYLQSPAKIGIVEIGEGEAVLIDSGSDRDAGRKARQALDGKGWRLRAIYNTHSNADHIGGNAYLQKQTGCSIYAPRMECAFTRDPIFEPSLLWGGYPMKGLRHKFLLAQESDARELTAENLPQGFERIELPGHFLDMVGYRTPDDAVFLADCLSSEETLNKYRIGFIYDVGAYLQTLERVKNLRARVFIPSHAEVTEDIAPLAQKNIDAVNAIIEDILSLCAEGLSFETLLARLFTSYGLKMTLEQHALVGSTVRSYLSYLCDTERMETCFADNVLLFRTSR